MICAYMYMLLQPSPDATAAPMEVCRLVQSGLRPLQTVQPNDAMQSYSDDDEPLQALQATPHTPTKSTTTHAPSTVWVGTLHHIIG